MNRLPTVFDVGQSVEKVGFYGGPGIVRGYCYGSDNQPRYIVAHKIEGGHGELLHIYMAKDLRPVASSPRLLHLAFAERQRQIDMEGFDAAHDDAHVNGELAKAAACYIIHAVDPNLWPIISGEAGLPPFTTSDADGLWPFELEWWKPKDPESDLVRGFALLIAEAQRRDRAAAQEAMR